MSQQVTVVCSPVPVWNPLLVHEPLPMTWLNANTLATVPAVIPLISRTVLVLSRCVAWTTARSCNGTATESDPAAPPTEPSRTSARQTRGSDMASISCGVLPEEALSRSVRRVKVTTGHRATLERRLWPFLTAVASTQCPDGDSLGAVFALVSPH